MLNKLKNKALLLSGAMLTSPLFALAEGPDSKGDKYFDSLGIQGSAGAEATLNGINDTLLSILGFARGAGIVVCVIMLAWCAIQLAMSAGNQQKRQMAMEGIKNVLIAVAIIGGATILASLAYGFLA